MPRASGIQYSGFSNDTDIQVIGTGNWMPLEPALGQREALIRVRA